MIDGMIRSKAILSLYGENLVSYDVKCTFFGNHLAFLCAIAVKVGYDTLRGERFWTVTHLGWVERMSGVIREMVYVHSVA
jgi:hypothetical protein